MNDQLYSFLNKEVHFSDIKHYDFIDESKKINQKIIDYLRISQSKLEPDFFNTIIHFCDNNVKVDDKKKKYGSAVLLASLTYLYPYDYYVPRIYDIVVSILSCDSNHIIESGAKLVGRISSLKGENRDAFLYNLLNSEFFKINTEKMFKKYRTIMLWYNISINSPEFVYENEYIFSEFSISFLTNLLKFDRQIIELYAYTIDVLFKSESASAGVMFLSNLQTILSSTTLSNFLDLTDNESIIRNYYIFIYVLNLKPLISYDIVKIQLLPRCYSHLRSNVYDIVFNAARVIFDIIKLYSLEIPELEREEIFLILCHYIRYDSKSVKNLLREYIYCVMHTDDDTFSFVQSKILYLTTNKNMSSTHQEIGFELLVTALSLLPRNSEYCIKFIKTFNIIVENAVIHFEIDRFLTILNENNDVTNEMFYSFNEMISKIVLSYFRDGHNIIGLKAVLKLWMIPLRTALELERIIESYTSLDTSAEIRQLAMSSLVHIHEVSDCSLGLESFAKLVKKVMTDPSKLVRLSSINSFTQKAYVYLSQHEVFKEFCKFFFDESFEVRKSAIKLIRKLPVVQYEVVRMHLFNSLRQMNPDISLIVPNAIPTWKVFPHLLKSCAPILHLYAEGLYRHINEIIKQRFFSDKNEMNIFTNSIILKDIDEGLFNSITKLGLICPKQIPSRPIFDILCKILHLPVHNWTKVSAIKYINILIRNNCEFDSSITNDMFTILRSGESFELNLKTLKVLASIGVSTPPTFVDEASYVYRSALNDTKFFNSFLLTKLFNFINQEFVKFSDISSKESICTCVSYIFREDSSSISSFLQPFLGNLLHYIKASQCLDLTPILRCLCSILQSSKNLVSKYIDSIYDSIYEHWIGDYTKEISYVISSLIIASSSVSDIILQGILSTCFHILKTKHIDDFSSIFYIYRTIAKVNPSYIASMVSDLINIISTQQELESLTEHCATTIEYFLLQCKSEYITTMIIKFAQVLKSRPQTKWRLRSNGILNRLITPSELDSTYQQNYDTFSSIKPFKDNLKEHGNSISYLESLLNNSTIISDKAKLSEGFSIYKDLLILNSKNHAICSMAYLDTKPKVAFSFSFVLEWFIGDTTHRSKLIKLLNMLLGIENLPVHISNEIIELVELTLVCKIDIGINLHKAFRLCIDMKNYSVALAIYEYLSLNGYRFSEEEYKDLLFLNTQLKRYDEASSVQDYISNIDYRSLMYLQDWKKALTLLKSEKNRGYVLRYELECLASSNSWKQITEISNLYEMQNIYSKHVCSRYFSMAEMFCGDIKKSLYYINSTSCYQAKDCICRAMFHIIRSEFDKAKDIIHLGWRYLTTVVGNINKNNSLEYTNILIDAEKLTQLTDIIEARNDEKHIQTFRDSWNRRLPFLLSDTVKKREFYSIIKTAPDLFDYTEYILKEIRRAVRAHKIDEANAIAEISCFDESTQEYQLCKILLNDNRRERIQWLKEKYNLFDGTFKERINVLLAKDILYESRTKEEVEMAYSYIKNSVKGCKFLFYTLMLILNIQYKDEYVDEIFKVLTRLNSYSAKKSLYNTNILSLLIRYKNSEYLHNKVRDCIHLDNIVVSILMCFMSNSSNFLRDTAVELIKKSLPNFNEDLSIKLFNEINKNPNSEILDEILSKVNYVSPIIYSQSVFLAKSLVKISNNICRVIKDELKNFNKTKSLDILLNIKKLLHGQDMSVFDAKFRKNYGESIDQLVDELISDTSNVSAYHQVIKKVDKYIESSRIIKLSDLDEALVHKKSWRIGIPSLRAIKNHVKLVKFFHLVRYEDNQIIFAMVGSDGLKYSFFLKSFTTSTKDEENTVEMLYSIIPDLSRLTFRYSVDLDLNVSLSEKMKGKITLLNMIDTYRSSLENYEGESSEKDLAKAILVTSSSAKNWLDRQGMFSRTYGTFAGLCYILGGVDSSLNSIFFDKLNGSVTFSDFRITEELQKVPINLTQYIVNVFGSCGINGPFRNMLKNFLVSIRKHKLGIGSIVQFTDDCFEESYLPSRYIENFVENETFSSKYDNIYFRISGETEVNEKEIDKLISASTNEANISEMSTLSQQWF